MEWSFALIVMDVAERKTRKILVRNVQDLGD
jgi:hypothetical protein